MKFLMFFAKSYPTWLTAFEKAKKMNQKMENVMAAMKDEQAVEREVREFISILKEGK